jgi:sugar phosphate isomerase/epimerase
MSDFANRRQFMLASVAGAAALTPSAVRAIEPIERTEGHHFKFSLAAYSYRELFGEGPGKLSLVDFIEDCAKFNLDAAELTSYYFPANMSADYLRQLKGECFRRGLDISGTAVGNDFCIPPGDERSKQIESVKQWIERADQLDAPVIRIFAGKQQPGQSLVDAQQLAIQAIEECCEHAGKYGVFLALENHGGITAAVDDMLGIVRAVKSPWFGVNLDTGNFRTADPYADLAKLAPYALNVQVKVTMYPAGKPSEPADFERLAKILKASGYRGYIVLEYEDPGDPRVECPKYLEELRVAFGVTTGRQPRPCGHGACSFTSL